jgi:hypothetical protein
VGRITATHASQLDDVLGVVSLTKSDVVLAGSFSAPVRKPLSSAARMAH